MQHPAAVPNCNCNRSYVSYTAQGRWISNGTKKSCLNERKHGVPFRFATRVFLDENRLEWVDIRHQYGEPRWITIGLIESMEIAVVYTLRGNALRLISARKAERHEREDYWNR